MIRLGINFEILSQKEWSQNAIYAAVSIGFTYLALILVTVAQRRKVVASHQNEQLLKEEFIAGANLDSKSLVAKDLLGLLLPKFVLDEVQNPFDLANGAALAREVGDVAILFCDIADFDQLVRKVEGNIVYLLDKIVRRFDDLCVLHGVQKIETVGKTYMAVGGLRQVEQALPPDLKVLNFTLRTLNLAKDMMAHIKEFDGLQLKIGIHVGRPVMGVIGYHKPQFSLIGDAVNTASRHCATGKKGRIMVSESAFEALEHVEAATRGYKVETVFTEMKGKGMVKVYHIYPSTFLFNEKLKNILDRGSHQMENEQLRQITVLHKASLKRSASETEQELPEAGGYYSIVLQNIKKASTLSKAFIDSKLTPRLADRSGPHTERHHARSRGTQHLGNSMNLRPSDTREIRPSRKLVLPSMAETSKLEPFLIDASVFDVCDEEKLEEEVQSNNQTEKLIPSKYLGFRSSQYDLVRKYKANLKNSNHANLRVFFIILCCEYILAIILHSFLAQTSRKSQTRWSNQMVAESD
jgi:class 3 adenylate cyclase